LSTGQAPQVTVRCLGDQPTRVVDTDGTAVTFGGDGSGRLTRCAGAQPEDGIGAVGKRVASSALLTLAIGVFIVFVYLVLRAAAALQQGYTWSDMDWNSDGSTSIFELFESSDIGSISVVIDNQECIEYFRYKDGDTVKIACRQ